jgi:hypothetical protein
MDLLDVLSNNTTAKSVVELTLSPQCQYSHSALNKAIATSGFNDKQLAYLASKTIPSL